MAYKYCRVLSVCIDLSGWSCTEPRCYTAGFFQSYTAGYLKTQVQNCALSLAEHDSLGINLKQKSETLSHVRCHFSISLIRFLLF